MVKFEMLNKFISIYPTLKRTHTPNILGAIWNQWLMMAPLLSLKHAYAIQQISWKSLKSIKIIYYLWDGANYLKYSCSVSTLLQQVLIGILQLKSFFFLHPPHRQIIKNVSPSISSRLQMLRNVESPEQTVLIYSSYCFFVLLGRH